MGRVYLAHESPLDRDVALKFIAAERPSADTQARFLREGRAIARLQHPNIVAIYQIGDVDGRPYIAYEYVDGVSIDRIAKPVPWTSALHVGLAVARALALAHSRGVLHRDVKPGNIIAARDGSIKLVDFGLAKLSNEVPGESGSTAPEGASLIGAPLRAWLESVDATPANRVASKGIEGPMLSDVHTQTGGLVGTPNYLAPELWSGERASFRSDVYALGLVIYELCSGQIPFNGLKGRALVDRVREAPLPPLAHVCPTVPLSLSQIVDRAIAHDPAARFADAGKMLAALEAVDIVLHAFRRLGHRRGGMDDASLAAASLSRVQGRAEEFFTSFYERLFAGTPTLAALFPSSLAKQKVMLAAALRLAVDDLREPETLAPVLEDLGRRHAKYGVQPSSFEPFEQALISSLRAFDTELDAATERAWRRAFGAITAAMRRGMELSPQRQT